MAHVSQPEIHVPAEFHDSYQNFHLYPTNVLPISIVEQYDNEVLSLIRSRLELRQSHAKPLLLPEVPKQSSRWSINFNITDILADGSVVEGKIQDDFSLARFLEGSRPNIQQLQGITIRPYISRPDPRCRFIFLPSQRSITPLQLSLSNLQRILSYHQVMPFIIDFLLVYGTEYSLDREISFSGFHTDVVTSLAHPGNIIPGLGRSGNRYQICYNIKRVSQFEWDPKSQMWNWTYRQTVVYHQFDLSFGTQVWIVGDPGFELSTKTAGMFQSAQNHLRRFGTYSNAFLSSLGIHKLYIYPAIDQWRQIIQHAAENVSLQTLEYAIKHNPRNTVLKQLTADEIYVIKRLEDQLGAALAVLEANEGTLTSLRKFYSTQVQPLLCPRQAPGHSPDVLVSKQDAMEARQNIRQFAWNLDEWANELKLQIKHVKLLEQSLAGKKTILLQHLQNQSDAKTEDLNASMWALAKDSRNEAIAMRIITVVTLIFLPATFVSTFFSAGVIKAGDTNPNLSSDSPIAAENTGSAAATQPGDITFPNAAGNVSTNYAMLSLWAIMSGVALGVTALSTALWIKYERGRLKKVMKSLEEQWPGIYQSIKAFS